MRRLLKVYAFEIHALTRDAEARAQRAIPPVVTGNGKQSPAAWDKYREEINRMTVLQDEWERVKAAIACWGLDEETIM